MVEKRSDAKASVVDEGDSYDSEGTVGIAAGDSTASRAEGAQSQME